MEAVILDLVVEVAVEGLVEEVVDTVGAVVEAPVEEVAVFRAEEDEDAFTIEREDGCWRVRGRKIERVVAMTNWDYYEAVMRFQRILDAMGISQALEEAGVQEGDAVRIGDAELVWGWEQE